MEYDRPWVQLLVNNCNFSVMKDLSMQPKLHASYIWQGLCWSCELLHTGVGRRVRNGCNTLFWCDFKLEDVTLQEMVLRLFWCDFKLEDVTLQEMVLRPIPQDILSFIVADYWDAQCG